MALLTMALSRLRIAALLALALTATAATAARNGTVEEPALVQGAYMVELAANTDPAAFYAHAIAITGDTITPRKNTSSSVFTGVSFQLRGTAKQTAAHAAQILALTQVKALWPVTVVAGPNPLVDWTGASHPTTAAQKRALAARGFLKGSTSAPHKMTQVDKLHAKNITGAGMRIALVDTGIDYTHPALGGGCFGKGCAVVTFGTDLVGDGYNGTNTPVPDPNPLDTCYGHGTHVAGIIAAQANDMGVVGAAPGVELGMYRVFGCMGQGVGIDVLVAATNMAFADGADIISISVGAMNGWSEEAWAVTAQRIVEAGVPVVIASGNKGNEAMFYYSTPAGGKGVMGIASVDNTETYNLTSDGVVVSPLTGGGFPSDYTSWGPMNELEVKPQFGTVGRGILSTFPVALGSWATLSGTSMATPLAAAIVALVGQARGTLDPGTIERLLSATARPNTFPSGGTNRLALVPQQGAGLVQAFDAAYSTVLLNVSNLPFNDTDYFTTKKTFTVTNTGTKAITFNLSSVPTITAYTLANGSIYPESWIPELVDSPTAFASIRFEPATLTVPAGASAVVTVLPKPPSGLDASRIPVYSGYVTLNGTGGINLSIPYQGVAASMHDAVTVLDPRTGLTRADTTAAITDNTTVFVLPPPKNGTQLVIAKASKLVNSKSATYLPYGVLPNSFVVLPMGSALVRADVVPLDNATAASAVEVLGYKTLGNIAGLPALYLKAAGWFQSWNGLLEDGTWAPPGQYRLALRALKFFGDRDVAEDYSVIETVSFGIVYAVNDM